MIGLDAAVDVRRAIDDGPVTAFQVRAIALCSLVAFLDGLDSQSIAVAGPIIADLIGLQRSALGPVFSAGVLRAMLGALTFGPLGDRFGRKRVLVASAVIFGAFTGAGAHGLAAGVHRLHDRGRRRPGAGGRATTAPRRGAGPGAASCSGSSGASRSARCSAPDRSRSDPSLQQRRPGWMSTRACLLGVATRDLLACRCP